MNDRVKRELLAQSFIVLAVCIGGWMMLVEPRMQKVNETEQSIEELSAIADGVNQNSIEALAGRMAELRQRVLDTQRRNMLAADSSQIYSAIMDIANDHDVLVRSLQPSVPDRQDTIPAVMRTRLDMTVESSYASLGQFLEAVEDIDGYIVPRSLSLSPQQRAGQNIVVARFSGEILGFALSDPLKELGGASDAQQ